LSDALAFLSRELVRAVRQPFSGDLDVIDLEVSLG
jgi:hypothetical protein